MELYMDNSLNECGDDQAERTYRWQRNCSQFLKKYSHVIALSMRIIFILAVGAYISYALYYNVEDNISLIVFSAFAILFGTGILLKPVVTRNLKTVTLTESQKKCKQCATRCFWSLISIGLIIYIFVDISTRNPEQLISLGGISALVLFCFIFSKDPAKVPWEVVLSGLTVQIGLALLVLRWSPAADALEWLGNQISTFMYYSSHGARFVFGDKYVMHPFAMEVMPIVIWFSAVSALLQHWGILQPLVALVGGGVKLVVGTSTVECFVAVANIFFGPNESVLMLTPMVSGLTQSQIHSLVTSGLATIDGGTLAAFINMGIPAKHLVAASILSAPAALVTAKMLVPEKKKLEDSKLQFQKSEAGNAIEAFSEGACMGAPIVAAVLATLIGFLAVLEFMNATLTWFGDRAGVVDLTLQKLLGWILTPAAFIIGVPWQDCTIVAELIGIKTILNEYVAYTDLATYIANRNNGTEPYITEKSETIATYALCGYSNFGTISTMLGFIFIIAPNKFGDLSDVAIRTVVASTVACLLTSAIAGLLYTD